MQNDTKNKEIYLNVGTVYERALDKYGYEISLVDLSNSNLGIGVGLLMFEDPSTKAEEDNYGGIYGFMFNHYESWISPYIGAGVFLAKDEDCTKEEKEEGCKENYVFNIYPEVGLMTVIDKVNLKVYARRYIGIIEKFQYKAVFGLSVGYKF